MTEEIMIDVSNCPHKRDDECMEVPICNEYGDLMGYQSCEAQTLCSYRSQKKIERLKQENKQMKSALEEIREINKLFFERKYGYPEDLIKIDNIINEVLQ